MNSKGLAVSTYLFFFLNTCFSQNVASGLEKKIQWIESSQISEPVSLNYPLSNRPFGNDIFPAITEVFETNDRAILEFTDLVYVPSKLSRTYIEKHLSSLKGQVSASVFHTLEGDKIYTGYYLCPFKEQNGVYYQLNSFKVNVLPGEPFAVASSNNSTSKRAAANSVLASGTWLKFSVTETGLYKLSATDLTNAGVNLANIDPRNIKLYTHQGGMLPEKNSDFRYDDLPEIAIQVIGESDGVFDQGDHILFYAESPHKWRFDNGSQRFKHVQNIYSDKTFIFVNLDGAPGKRMSVKSEGSHLNADASYNWFDFYLFHEKELENTCNEGRVYLGERFDQNLIYNFNHSIPNASSNKNVRVYFEAAAISPVSSSLLLKMNNVNSYTMNLSALNDVELCYMDAGIGLGEIASTSSLNLSFLYNQPVSSSKAWLNYYELHATRNLYFSESFMPFRNIDSRLVNIAEYRLSNLPSGAIVLDVTDPVSPIVQMLFNDGGQQVFRTATNGLIRQYVLGDGNLMSPLFEGNVINQNLHSTGIVQFIIISHPDFLDAANKLADWHRNRDNMTVKVVTPQQIYNEFSCGSQDISAIRDYLKHVYYGNMNPANQLKYALLMGDASFDYKDRLSNNTNFVPVYESEAKWNYPYPGTDYYCSDDFYGFLDSTDGAWRFEQRLEITVSRLPVASPEEAMAVVDKTIHYKDKESLGDWRSFVTFCADDADDGWETEFVTDFESIYDILDSNYENVNVRKVYIDAFKQQNLGGSQRYPDAQQAIKKEFEQGTLVFNYIGHGGEEYLASEKVIDIPMINALNNYNTLPAFFTATCEFSRYDNAKHKSAGEYVMTQAQGGSIAMFTTTRVVGSFANYQFTKEFWQNCVYTKFGDRWPTLGEVYKKLKNWSNMNANDRRFTLFGDPALTLNYPEYIIEVDSINGASVSPGNDTLKALNLITFSGHIEDVFGNNLDGFNGTVYPIVYDKPSQFKTLNNDAIPGAELPFELYSNILYKGKSSVINGKYSFSFVVPKDINYTYGYGKLSFYAENQDEDAWGSNRNFYIGGASNSAVADVTGPEIELFVDDYDFISGGLTDNTPLLLARVYDEHGINTSGIGIGRDIVAIIDKGTANEKRYVLNAFYSAKLNSYTTGDIRYQLEGIADGLHTYTLKVWDVYNNSSEATIEFLVKNDDEMQLEHVLNYPNPFSTNTVFHFDHNLSGQNLNVVITIMTITGKVMKTIESYVPNAPGHVASISWNGRDDYDDKPSKGVYIYRITVTTEDGRKAEQVEKLVILN